MTTKPAPADRALADRLQEAVVTIGPMTRDELAETIVKPAQAVELAFEVGLVETILDDIGEEPGSLPLGAVWNVVENAVMAPPAARG